MNGIRNGRRLAALAAALALAGCASYKGIEPQAKLRDTAVPGASAQVAPVPADWWREFGDPQLDRLETAALSGGPTLGIAAARLRRAQAAVDAAHSADLPHVNGEASIQRQRFSENSLYPPPLGGGIFNMGTLQADASWELDFFGKNAAALRAAIGTTRAAEADVAAARVVLASNVARTYFQLLRIQEQLGVARRALAQREETFRLVRDRVTAGLDTTLEDRQAAGALPEARQQIEALQEQAATTRNALIAVVGSNDVPAAGSLPPIVRIRASTALPALPADLIARRPDVAAARWRVEAATQDVRSAKAQFYPNINLTAFLGLSSLGLDRLLDVGSKQWGVGPALSLPIFDAGQLRANLRGKTADLDVAIESYNSAVIEAIHEAGDAVATLRSLDRQIAEQRQALAAAEGAYDIALQRYRAGLGTYLNVLTVETNVLAQRRLGVDLAARVLDARVQLYRALGGGYAAGATNDAATAAAAPAATAAVH